MSVFIYLTPAALQWLGVLVAFAGLFLAFAEGFFSSSGPGSATFAA